MTIAALACWPPREAGVEPCILGERGHGMSRGESLTQVIAEASQLTMYRRRRGPPTGNRAAGDEQVRQPCTGNPVDTPRRSR